MNIVVLLLYLALVALFEVVLRPLTSIYGVSLNLPMYIVIVVGLRLAELRAAWFGFLVGLVSGAVEPATMGWQALLMALFGVAAFHLRERFNMETLSARMMLLTFAFFLHGTLVLLITHTGGFLYEWLRSALPGALYSTLAAWLIYRFLGWRGGRPARQAV